MSQDNNAKQDFIETSDAKESREFLAAKVAELTEKLEK